MKVIVLWENPGEQSLATNLVAVLKAIGSMLIYGKVSNKGVLLEDWQSKPRVKMDCMAAPSPAMASPPNPGASLEYSFASAYDGYDMEPMRTQGTLSITTRELMRDLVRMFPDEGTTAKPKTPRKPVVPKPNTTETGVTVRALDMWEEDEEHK